MAFIVVYDACVLYPAPLRDLLMRIAHAGLVRARWTETILDECFRSIAASKPDINPTALERTRRLMNAAVADALVTGYEPFVLGLIDLAPGAVASIVVQQASALKNPPRSPAELLETLREQGFVRSVAKLRELLGIALKPLL